MPGFVTWYVHVTGPPMGMIGPGGSSASTPFVNFSTWISDTLAEVVRRIVVDDLGAARVDPGGDGGVLVQPECRDPGRGAAHLLTDGQRRLRTRHRHALVVGDRHAGERMLPEFVTTYVQVDRRRRPG